MKKYNLKDIEIPNLTEYIIIAITIFILLLLGTGIFNFKTINYYNYQINLEIILSVAGFLIISTLKNINKIKMITILNRFNQNTLTIMIAYQVSAITLFLLMILLGNISSIVGIIIVILEITLIIAKFYANMNSQIDRGIIKMVLAKEFHYMILMVCLLLNNFPFELVNIPMTVILSASYIVVQTNLVYAYVKTE